MQIWAEKNPFSTRAGHSQYKFSVNVWCAVFDHKLSRPRVFLQTLTGEIYLDFLQNILPVLLDDAGVDVAGMHFHTVTDFLMLILQANGSVEAVVITGLQDPLILTPWNTTFI